MGVSLFDQNGVPVEFASKLSLFFNNEIVAETDSVSLKGMNGINIIRTQEGLFGFSSGEAQATVDATIFIPLEGVPHELWDSMVKESYVTIQLGIGRADFISTGKLTECNMESSTKDVAKCTFQWVGKLVTLDKLI